MKKEDAEKSFEIAFDELNWHKIHDVMEFLNWQWAGCSGVPSVSEMKKTVKDLFKQISVYEYGNGLATGGFRVFVEAEGDIEYISIQFILNESDGILE